jgi:hypothetical protein
MAPLIRTLTDCAELNDAHARFRARAAVGFSTFFLCPRTRLTLRQS